VTERLGNCCNWKSNFLKDSVQVFQASSILVGGERAKGLVSVLQKKTVNKKWSNTVAQMSTRHAFMRHEVASDGTTSWHLIAAKNLLSVSRDDRNTPLNVLPWNASWLTSTPIAWLQIWADQWRHAYSKFLCITRPFMIVYLTINTRNFSVLLEVYIHIYLLQLGCYPVAVVILHVNQTWNWLLLDLSLEGYMRSM